MQRLQRALSRRRSGHLANAFDAVSLSDSPAPECSADAPGAAADDAFAGWEAEDALSTSWGSRGGSMCSIASQEAPRDYQPALLPTACDVGGRPWSAGSCGAQTAGSRPGSAGSEGQYHMQYTVRSDSILGARPGAHGTAGATPPACAASVAEPAWERARYPPLYSPAESQASEAHPELAEEPSAPPLENEPWAAGAESGATSPGSDSSDSPASGMHSPPPGYIGTWGAASAACGTRRWTSESAAPAGPLADSLLSRQVSEETGRYQQLLETLAACGREAAAAAAPAAAAHAEGSGLSAPASRAPSEGAAGPWQSPLLQVQLPRSPQAACAVPSSGGSSPVRWAGVQTLLSNLAKSAGGGAVWVPAAGLSFWDQLLTEEEEAAGAGEVFACAPAAAGPGTGGQLVAQAQAQRASATPSPRPCGAQRAQPRSPASPCSRPPQQPQPSSAALPSPSAQRLSPARLLTPARWWGGSSPGRVDAGSSPPRGIQRTFAPLGEQ